MNLFQAIHNSMILEYGDVGSSVIYGLGVFTIIGVLILIASVGIHKSPWT